MRYIRILYALLGAALFIWIIAESDFAQVADRVRQVGWGALAIFGVFFAVFFVDCLTWQMTFARIRLNGTWLYRLWKVRMVGEAFNSTIPAGSMGGEPVKARLLRKHYAVPYKDGIASLVMGRTINVIALLPFIAIGFWFMVDNPHVSTATKNGAALGFVGFSAAIIGFFFFQRLKLSSRIGRFLNARAGRISITNALDHLHDIEDQMVRFYTKRRARFFAALTLSFGQWVLGALEVYLMMFFLGVPVSFAEAWAIEAAVQFVRAGTFFIPASLGTQDGAFLLIVSAITGSAELGVAAAVLRRLREIVWIGWGLLIGLRYSTIQATARTNPDAATDESGHGSAD